MPPDPADPRELTQDERDLLQYQGRIDRPTAVKIPEFARDERLRHVIFSRQFSVDLLEDLAATADMIRGLSKSRPGQDFLINLLHHKRAMLYFTQPSTRTFLSFMAACQILGITCNEVRDPSTSSRDQGRNAVRLDPHVFELLRHDRHAQPHRPAGRGVRVPDERPVDPRPAQRADRQRGLGRRPASHAGAARRVHAAAHVSVRQPEGLAGRRTGSTSSAGSIPAAHRGLAGKTYGFCGDIGRGRTVRSLAELLAGYRGVTLIFVSPQNTTLRLRDDMRQRLWPRGVRFFEVDSLEEPIDGRPVIEQVDALYMTRIQKEHNNPADEAAFAGDRLRRSTSSPASSCRG